LLKRSFFEVFCEFPRASSSLQQTKLNRLSKLKSDQGKIPFDDKNKDPNVVNR